MFLWSSKFRYQESRCYRNFVIYNSDSCKSHQGIAGLAKGIFGESETRDNFITVWGKSLGGAGERNCRSTLSGWRYSELTHKLGGSLKYGSCSGVTSRDNNTSFTVILERRHSDRWRIKSPGRFFLLIKRGFWAFYQLPRCLLTWNGTSSSAMFYPTPKITNQFSFNASYLTTSYLSVPN